MSDQKAWAFALTAWADYSGAISANPGPERLAEYLTDAVKRIPNQARARSENHALGEDFDATVEDGVGLHGAASSRSFPAQSDERPQLQWDAEAAEDSPRRARRASAATYTKDISRARVATFGYLNKAQHHFETIGQTTAEFTPWMKHLKVPRTT